VKNIFTGLVLLSGFMFSSLAWSALQDFNGKPGKLEDYTGKGKWTVVMFWASDCHVCNAEAQQYVKYHEANKKEKVVILGVTLDGQDKKAEAEAFVKRNAVTFDNLIGEPEEIASLFESLTGGTWVGTPTFLIYNPAGELKAAQPGAVPTSLIDEFIVQQSKQAQNQ
jgi:peroxiredoxin